MIEPTTQNNTPNDAMSVAKYTYRYHNDSLNVLNFLILGIVALIVLLALFIFVQIGTKPKAIHIPLNANLQLTTPVPLNKEGISTAALVNWVNEIVMKAFSFNYSNIKRQEAKMSPYFSDVAMKIYLDLINTSEAFQIVTENKFVVSVVPKSTPDILVGRAFNDRFAWQIRVPVQIIFNNALVRSSQDITFDFLVWRVPETESELGILVATFTYKMLDHTLQQPISIF